MRFQTRKKHHLSPCKVKNKKTKNKRRRKKLVYSRLLRRKKKLSPFSLSQKELTFSTMAAEQLVEVSTVDLMTEVARRLECATKPEKRLILVGE